MCQFLLCPQDVIVEEKATQGDAMDTGATECLTALTEVTKMTYDDWEDVIGAFKPKFGKPKDGKAWLWELTLRDSPPDSLKDVLNIGGTLHKCTGIKIEHSRVFQTLDEKALWDWHKKQH